MEADAPPSLSSQVELIRARLRQLGREELSKVALTAAVSVATLYRVRQNRNVSVNTLDRVQLALTDLA
jgi:hypothetical protein